jgi:hypothetical protein
MPRNFTSLPTPVISQNLPTAPVTSQDVPIASVTSESDPKPSNKEPSDIISMILKDDTNLDDIPLFLPQKKVASSKMVFSPKKSNFRRPLMPMLQNPAKPQQSWLNQPLILSPSGIFLKNLSNE